MKTWMRENLGKTQENIAKELIKVRGVEAVMMKKLEKGGKVASIKEKNAVATMGKIKDTCSKETIRMGIPKKILEAAAKVIIRSLNNNSVPVEPLSVIEKSGEKVTNSHLIKNEENGMFTGLAKVALI